MSTLIETKGLKKYFPTPHGMLHAVDDVNIKIEEGHTLGVVGESGCGKSTLGRTLIHLHESTDGQIFFEGKDVTHVGKSELKALREQMQIIFQDPYSSIDPRMTVKETIKEPLQISGRFSKGEIEDAAEELMNLVGLDQWLLSRAASEQARRELRFTYDKALDYCRQVRQYSISPGNFAGGLTTIEEKSMGAVIKSGSRPIQGVIKVSCPPPRPGLWLLDSTPDPSWMQFGITNPNDNEGLMDLVSCGAHIVFLVTGRGNVVGSAVSPCIKITGNAETFARMSGDMDFDASPVLRGECGMDELERRLEALVVSVAAGSPARAETLGHREFFIPYKYQEKQVSFSKTCEQ